MIRLALLSNWHVHAADYARDSIEHLDVELAVVWDDDAERGQAAAARFGARFEPNLASVLANPAVAGVIVTSATTEHKRLIPAAAGAGKHVFAEKVIAPTLHASLGIVRAIENRSVIGAIALTRAQQPSTVAALEAVASGTVGTVTSVRVRLAHDGALPAPDQPRGWLPERFYNQDESAGGALIDLGAHPLYLTRLFLGLPKSVTAIFGDVTGREVDDNSVVVFRTGTGAYGIAETGFVSRGGGFGFEIRGTEGTIAFHQGEHELTLLRRNAPSELIPVPGTDEPPFARWIRAIQEGTPLTLNLNLALELSALVEASAVSALSETAVALDSLAGWSELQSRIGGG